MNEQPTPERAWECRAWLGLDTRQHAALINPEGATALVNHSRLVRGQLRKRPGLARFAVKSNRVNALYQTIAGGEPVLMINDGDQVQALGGPDRWVGPGEPAAPDEPDPRWPWEPPGDEPDLPGRKRCCHYGNTWGVSAWAANNGDLHVIWRPADGYDGQDRWDTLTGQPYPWGEKPQYYEIYLQYEGPADWTGWCTPDAWQKVMTDTLEHALALPETWPHVVDVGEYGGSGVTAWKWQLVYKGLPIIGRIKVPYVVGHTVTGYALVEDGGGPEIIGLGMAVPDEYGGVVGMSVVLNAPVNETRTIVAQGETWIQVDRPFSTLPVPYETAATIEGEALRDVTQSGTITGDHGDAGYTLTVQRWGELEQAYHLHVIGAKGALMSDAEWAVLMAGGSVPRISVFPVYASGPWGGCGESAAVAANPPNQWVVEVVEFDLASWSMVGFSDLRTGYASVGTTGPHWGWIWNEWGNVWRVGNLALRHTEQAWPNIGSISLTEVHATVGFGRYSQVGVPYPPPGAQHLHATTVYVGGGALPESSSVGDTTHSASSFNELLANEINNNTRVNTVQTYRWKRETMTGSDRVALRLQATPNRSAAITREFSSGMPSLTALVQGDIDGLYLSYTKAGGWRSDSHPWTHVHQATRNGPVVTIATAPDVYFGQLYARARVVVKNLRTGEERVLR